MASRLAELIDGAAPGNQATSSAGVSVSRGDGAGRAVDTACGSGRVPGSARVARIGAAVTTWLAGRIPSLGYGVVQRTAPKAISDLCNKTVNN